MWRPREQREAEEGRSGNGSFGKGEKILVGLLVWVWSKVVWLGNWASLKVIRKLEWVVLCHLNVHMLWVSKRLFSTAISKNGSRHITRLKIRLLSFLKCCFPWFPCSWGFNNWGAVFGWFFAAINGTSKWSDFQWAAHNYSKII